MATSWEPQDGSFISDREIVLQAELEKRTFCNIFTYVNKSEYFLSPWGFTYACLKLDLIWLVYSEKMFAYSEKWRKLLTISDLNKISQFVKKKKTLNNLICCLFRGSIQHYRTTQRKFWFFPSLFHQNQICKTRTRAYWNVIKANSQADV